MSSHRASRLRAGAFLAKWTSPTGTGTGIFVGNPATLVVKTGDPAAEAAPTVEAPMAASPEKTHKPGTAAP